MALRLIQDPLAIGVGFLDVVLPGVAPRCVFPSLVLRAQFEGALVGGLVAKDEHAGGDDREAHERADREELDEHVDLDDEGHRAAGDARDEDGGERGLRARVDVRETAEQQAVGRHRVDGAGHGEEGADQRRTGVK